jgi:3'-phosphoadenosine 5'-phosphosulfate sulfotransferase (PAPS reductase)/FAD synthetase
MRLSLGRWADLLEHFAPVGAPSFGSISGGRSSGMMAAMLDERIKLVFQNTSREHPKTLTFLQRLEDALKRPITWLEYRSPPKKGDAPQYARFAIVTPETACRNGDLFRQLLEDLRDYRATKNAGPIAPWARSRICTAYLKHRVQERYIKACGIEAYDAFLGLRHDEPERVRSIQARDTQLRTYQCPLFRAGIVKADVGEFWSQQPFDLDLEDNQGNCTGCFLKDESDLARVMNEDESDIGWWERMTTDFPGFGGQRFKGYAALAAEGPLRLKIEAALKAGKVPENDGSMTPRRFKLVERQELRRHKGELAKFSCACESTVELADQLDIFEGQPA